jgi:hypothetical protein
MRMKNTKYQRFFESSYIEDQLGFSQENFRAISEESFKLLSSLFEKQDKILDMINSDWVELWMDQTGMYDTVSGLVASQENLLKLIKKQKPTNRLLRVVQIAKSILQILKKSM